MSKDIISNVSQKLCTGKNCTSEYPTEANAAELLKNLHMALFPELFGQETKMSALLTHVYESAKKEFQKAMCATCTGGCGGHKESSSPSEEIAFALIAQLPQLQQQLSKDAQAAFDNDPAAKCIEEVILAYPGFYALLAYRVANFLSVQGMPLIPRMMCEHAKTKTGIYIHPGATIGDYFFIDHGTGVVIGETSIIGNNVKIFQGVTLGSGAKGGGRSLEGTKRHPTIEDNVTILVGASILGGETVVGAGSVIGSNVVVKRSVPPNSILDM